MKTLGLACAFVLGVAASAAAGPLTLRFQDGFVTLSARDVPVREILALWARNGQTRIVNGERLAGGTVTLELAHVPEKQALEILLRSASGYMAAPRGVYAANLSVFDRIVIMPSSTAAPPPAAAAGVVRQMPGMPNPNAAANLPQVDDPDEPPSPNQPGVQYQTEDGPSPNPSPNGPPAFLPAAGEGQPVPEGQSPIRPYASPNDQNAGQQAPGQQQIPGPAPANPGVLTMPSPGQIPAPQKPPQQ